MASDTTAPDAVPADLVFEILSNRRRRLVLHYLRESGEPCTIQEMAEEIAARENDVSTEDLTAQERKRVYVSLYQTHIPKLAETGLVDDEREAVSLTDRAAIIEDVLVPVSESAYPWQKHYFVLSVLGGALFLLLVVGNPGIPPLAPSALGFVLVAAFGVSAYVQYWTRRRQEENHPESRLTLDS